MSVGGKEYSPFSVLLDNFAPVVSKNSDFYLREPKIAFSGEKVVTDTLEAMGDLVVEKICFYRSLTSQ